MSDLGPVPELDYSGLTQIERTKAKGASIGVRAWSHAARERIEQLEGEVERLRNVLWGRIEDDGVNALTIERLGKLLDEVAEALADDGHGTEPHQCELCRAYVSIKQERTQP